MASFFQPGSNDPAIADCEPSRFQIYCNSILPTDQLLRVWYQKLNLIVGAAALFLPLLYVIWYITTRSDKRSPTSSSLRSKKRKRLLNNGGKTPPPMPAFKAAKSFRVFEESDGVSNRQDGRDRDYDLLMLPITITEAVDGDSVSRSSHVPETNTPAKMNVACVDIDSLGRNALSDEELSSTATFLMDIYARTSLTGLALRCTSQRWPDASSDLLDVLYSNGVPIILMAHHDSNIWTTVTYERISGVIVESACILASGERRDYFQSRRLRDIMSWCNKQRQVRSEFFIGFLDLWEDRPHPAIIRRAVKLAEHFGAIMEHGPVNSGMPLGSTIRSASQTISGFEYLRRVELIDLQKAWINEQRQVFIPNNKKPLGNKKVSRFPAESLEAVVPGIARLLSPSKLPVSLEVIRDERPKLTVPLEYSRLAPPRTNFWDTSIHGQRYSSKGCFPLNAEANDTQYNAVVNTQTHLKELQMLQVLKGLEHHRILESLRRLVSTTKVHQLVHSLIEGLETHQVTIYKGLDTGFGVPEGAAYFWGVSSLRSEHLMATDIFISLKAPNDATTVLHTWLAHHGVSRMDRFEIEHAFEIASGLDEHDGLPISIRAAIQRSSHAEILSLLEQIHVSKLNHSFTDPMMVSCRKTLVQEVSKYSSSHLVAKSALDGSMSNREILQKRLEHYAERGAVSLPSLDNLFRLYEEVQIIVEDALFFGSRSSLNAMTKALVKAWDPEEKKKNIEYVDIGADLFALIFFTILRKAAFEDVYIEATDRCPFFLSQPDQAAVFSELWVLGSQCEIYFGLLPRTIGEIVYNRYKAFLSDQPPPPDYRKGTEIMTMYSNAEPDPKSSEEKGVQRDGSAVSSMTSRERVQVWRKRFTEIGAMSIFCLPAIMDVVLLTFVGRGVFMTAFMNPEHLQAAGLALLISLLLTAGVTGWVGSVGNYYLVNYAYDNMIYFHVQRLSGGFVLTLIIAVCGLIGFSVQYSVDVGFVFVAYLIAIATYFNLLGVMATMHQHRSPITSGRTVLWRTIPLLLVSPLLSSLVNGHDLEIYLPITYAFLFLALIQYRRLCREWCNWMDNIPIFSEKDVNEWYSASQEAHGNESDADSSQPKSNEKEAQDAFRKAVDSHSRGLSSSKEGKLISKVSKSLPYIDWLFKKACPDGNIPEPFSASWFTQLGEAIKSQRQLSRGLKEHNSLMLFRFARYDIGQNVGLFLVALMDRWVSLVMGSRFPRSSIYIDARSRYGICLSILYFCFSVMLLDTTLQKYWEVRYKLSDEKLANHEHAQVVRRQWELRRLSTFAKALVELLSKILFVFGGTTMILWILVDNPETIILYYLYVLGYTCVIIFQFNRCFTTNVRAHITIILGSALVGFITGCVLRAIPGTAGWLYSEVLSQNVAGVLAASGTLLWSWRDWSSPARTGAPITSSSPKPHIAAQRKISADPIMSNFASPDDVQKIRGATVSSQDGSFVAQEVSQLLRSSLSSPNAISVAAHWADRLLKTSLNMWDSRALTVTVASREEFIRAGLGHIWSFSQCVGETLEVTIGFLGHEELRSTSWQPQLATLTAEAVLYHIGRTALKLSHSKAVRSEHFLSQTTTLSRRLEFELAFEDEACITRICRKTNVELMKNLCLGIDVDASWNAMPQAAREAILARISESPVASSGQYQEWRDNENLDISTLDFHAQLCMHIFHKASEKNLSIAPFTSSKQSSSHLPPAALRSVQIKQTRAPGGLLQHWLRVPVSITVVLVRWVAVISTAGSDIERELWYCLKDVYFRQAILRFLLLAWNICRFVKNMWLYAMLIHSRPTMVKIARLAEKGARRKMHRNTITVELPRKTITGFATNNEVGEMILEVFDTASNSRPVDKDPLFTAVYDEQLRLKSRIDGSIVSNYDFAPSGQHRWPLSKKVTEEDFQVIGFYDEHGRVTRGTLSIEDKEFAFQYHYKATPVGCSDVLAADFKMISPVSEDVLSVFWGVPPDGDFESYDWVPSERICRLVKFIDGRTYVTNAEYQHRRDPLITTFLEEDDGRKTAISQAPMVFEEETLFLARPNNVSFDLDDLLVYHNKLQIHQMRRYARKKPSVFSYLNPVTWLALSGTRVYQPIPTWQIRTELWNDWLKSNSLDAPTACWIDELVLRAEPALGQYWRMRDSGRLHEAKLALDRNINHIVSAIDIQTDVSEVCLLQIKTTDLYAMGLGKDATQVTTRPQDCLNDTKERISVIFNDIGCWPEAPGGVSNCRRDLVNGHSTIRNHVLAECANDFGIPRFQVEKNVNSMKLLPLWGLDRKNAHHGLIDNLLQSQVDEKVQDTDVQRDIVGVFIPLLQEFVKGARTRRYSREDLIKYSNTMLSMSKYYEYKDYTRTWESREVEQAWVDAWLQHYDDDNVIDPSKCFELERPSMSDFRDAMGIYLAYFFIFSVQIPDRCPRVFQSTHHGISSLFGMILRYRRGVTFGIWDHAILWRECCLNISPAQCELPISVQSMLLSGIGLATRLAYFHADVIMPCTSLFNPMWEAEIGTDRGQLGSKSVFNRRIDPIVNGISNMESFTPVDKVRTETPTVVMLSNVQFIKGIKTAVLAADIIVNRWGFKDYKLVVYGAKDRQPSYAIEMAKLIVESDLSEHVILAGFGKPKEVLKDAWLFMNSSISEGLPLAIGEAALAGVPIVATEVGATALVLTDPEDVDQRYGEVVPPNDPLAIARAQISILSMTGPWAKFTEEVNADGSPSTSPDTLPDEITPGDVEWISNRMYEKIEDRRKLGLLSREVVLHSFHGNRYLREHEQMYWVQWHQSHMRDDAELMAAAANSFKFGAIPSLRYVDVDEEEDELEETTHLLKKKKKGDDRTLVLTRWQDFEEEGSMREKKRSPRRLSKTRKPSVEIRQSAEVSDLERGRR